MDKTKVEELEKELDLLFDDDFDFKPITKGLGFHHSIKEETNLQHNLQKQKIELQEDLQNRAKTLKINSTPPVASNMGDLAPFYEQEKKEQISINVNSNDIHTSQIEENVHFKSANYFARFGAWLVDLVLVLTFFVTSFITMMFASETPLSVVREIMMSAELFISIAPIFGIFYIFYFSFFDKTNFSTPGKRLLSLKVVNTNEENISLLQAFMRTLISLVSLLTFGLLVILDAQSKLTDTRVVKR